MTNKDNYSQSVDHTAAVSWTDLANHLTRQPQPILAAAPAGPASAPTSAAAPTSPAKWGERRQRSENGEEWGERRGRKELGGSFFIELFEKNFDRIASNEMGVSKKDIVRALGKPSEFSLQEYLMLEELIKYFDTICELSCTVHYRSVRVISVTHREVLKQFLVHTGFSMAQFDGWLNNAKPGLSPPPLCNAG